MEKTDQTDILCSLKMYLYSLQWKHQEADKAQALDITVAAI